jgi:hypothetical protein
VRLDAARLAACVAIACLCFCACGFYPVMLEPEVTPFGTAQAGGFIAAGGREGERDRPAPGVLDFGVIGRIGILPGVEVGARASLGGGGMADIRLQPLRRPFSISFDAAVLKNHFLDNPLDPHVPEPVDYAGVRPAAIIGIGPVFFGAAYSYIWSRGQGLGIPIYDTLRIPAAVLGARIHKQMDLLIEAEAFIVRTRHKQTPGFCLGLAGYSPPVRLWGRGRRAETERQPD